MMAPGHTVGANPLQGVAYVFVRSGPAWTLQQELTATDGADDELGAGDGFGPTVAVSGQTLIVSSGIADNFNGIAFIFVRSGTTWAQEQELAGAGGVQGFGCVVALSGSTAIIGARWVGANQQGAVFTFSRTANKWEEGQELTAANGAAGDQFGSSVAYFHRTLMVGAFHVESQTGAVYAFSLADRH
jgi:hypothetical protein